MKKIGSREFRIRLKEFLLNCYRSESVVYITNNSTEMGALVPVRYAKIIEQLMLKDGNDEKQIISLEERSKK